MNPHAPDDGDPDWSQYSDTDLAQAITAAQADADNDPSQDWQHLTEQQRAEAIDLAARMRPYLAGEATRIAAYLPAKPAEHAQRYAPDTDGDAHPPVPTARQGHTPHQDTTPASEATVD